MPLSTPARRAASTLTILAIAACSLVVAAPVFAGDLIPDSTSDSQPTESPSPDPSPTPTLTDVPSDPTESPTDSPSDVPPTDPEGPPIFAAFFAPAEFSVAAATPVAAVACVPVAGWATEDLAPTLTAGGLVFDGPHAPSVNYYQRVSAGNAQGLTGMSYRIAAGATGYGAELVVEVNPNADLGGGVIHYATLSTIGNPSTGTIDAQNGLWYTSKIAYASPGGMGNPLSWDALIALMPNNVLLSAPSLHLMTNSPADAHSIVTSVTSSCGTTDFTTPVAAVVPGNTGGTSGTTPPPTPPTTTTTTTVTGVQPQPVVKQLVTEALPGSTPTPSPKPSATSEPTAGDVTAAGASFPWLPWLLALLALLAILWLVFFLRNRSRQP